MDQAIINLVRVAQASRAHRSLLTSQYMDHRRSVRVRSIPSNIRL